MPRCVNACTAGESVQSATLPAFPVHPLHHSPLANKDSTAGQQGQSRHCTNLLSETVAKVSLSDPYCRMPWAISAFQDSRDLILPRHPPVSY